MLKESQVALKSARDLSRSLKRMARLMRNCQNCQRTALAAAGQADYLPECPVLVEINAQIEAAILDLNREWGLLP